MGYTSHTVHAPYNIPFATFFLSRWLTGHLREGSRVFCCSPQYFRSIDRYKIANLLFPTSVSHTTGGSGAMGSGRERGYWCGLGEGGKGAGWGGVASLTGLRNESGPRLVVVIFDRCFSTFYWDYRSFFSSSIFQPFFSDRRWFFQFQRYQSAPFSPLHCWTRICSLFALLSDPRSVERRDVLAQSFDNRGGYGLCWLIVKYKSSRVLWCFSGVYVFFFLCACVSVNPSEPIDDFCFRELA